MIEINLLPKELRKKKKKKQVAAMPKIPTKPVVIGIVCFVIILHISTLLLIKNKKDLSVSLNEKWSQMKPQKERTEAFFNELNSLQRRVEAVRKIAKPDISWTRLLNGLNQAMIPNIWLSEFRLTFKGSARGGRQDAGSRGMPKSLDLAGYAVGKSESAMPTVGKFMESLKRNKDFSDYIGEIELESIRNVIISGEEAMMFKLECSFRALETVSVQKSEEKSGRRR